jgi:4-hydroxythreonine-4-phosphate dehydrogenase
MGEVRRIGVTAGCPSGIGPEVMARALVRAQLPDEELRCLFIGPPNVLMLGAQVAGIEASLMSAAGSTHSSRVLLEHGDHRRFVECDEHSDLHLKMATFGEPDDAVLEFQKRALLASVEAAQFDRVHAIVTGPIRKRALLDVAGHRFAGQTELFHHYLHVDDDGPLMVFAGGPFLLGLCTVHVPLSRVSREITERRVATSLMRLDEVTRRVMGIERPRLAILGVNPHAGEGGLLGSEEHDVLEPALEHVRAKGLDVDGPLPADGFFANVARRGLDGLPHAVLAMHHDQGLAPYKMLTGGAGVNLTWGLQVPRTSPDHGTGDDIAGKGVADPSSTVAALELAARLVLE